MFFGHHTKVLQKPRAWNSGYEVPKIVHDKEENSILLQQICIEFHGLTSTTSMDILSTGQHVISINLKKRGLLKNEDNVPKSEQQP